MPSGQYDEVSVVGPAHVGIGLDMASGQYPCVPANASGYPDLITASPRRNGPSVRRNSRRAGR